MANTTPRLTLARKIFWQVFDDSSNAAIKRQFKRSYRYDQTDAGNDPTSPLQSSYPPYPALSQMPAIAVLPSGGSDPWVTNQQQNLNYRIDVHTWRATFFLDPIEAFWEQITKALWQTVNPSTGAQYWRGDPNNGRPVWNMEIGNFTVQPWKVEPRSDDSPWAAKMQFPITFIQLWNPLVQSN